MSDKKDNLRKWVASKLDSRAAKVKETGDEETVLFQYLVALSGASQALEAAGVEEESRSVVDLAVEIISEEYEAVQEKAAAAKKQAERDERLKKLLEG